MRPMKRNGVRIDDSFAEAFPMRGTAILITAPNRRWAHAGGHHHDRICDLRHRLRRRSGHRSANGPEKSTPDGRPGVRVLMFAMSSDTLQTQLVNRARPMRPDLARLRLFRRS